MEARNRFAEYFNFTRRQRVALVLLLCFCGLSFLATELLPVSGSGYAEADSSWIAHARSLLQNEPASGEEEEIAYTGIEAGPSVNTAEAFPFDPNTISEEGWKKLGVSPRTAATIRKYISKGGRFYKADDLDRIYGLSPEDASRLKPFVRIQQTAPENKWSQPESKERPAPFAVNINEADTTALIALPGIGSKLAARIITFREKLGGFHSVDQVAETYGLADSVFQKIRPRLVNGEVTIRKIDVNRASADELFQHPYINRNLANAIVAYREQHGNFSEIRDLLKLMLVTEKDLNKLEPYLSFIGD